MKALKNKQTDQIESYLESTVNVSLYSKSHDVVDVVLEGEDLVAFINEYVRPARDILLAKTDVKWIEKSSKGEDMTEINALKQALRDFPETVDLSEIDYLDQIWFPGEPEPQVELPEEPVEE
jgi:hypothetical protein